MWSWPPSVCFLSEETSLPPSRAQETPGNRVDLGGSRVAHSSHLKIRSLVMETASFTRSASAFLSYPLFSMDSGQNKCVYKQDSLNCWLPATLSFKGRKIKTIKVDRIFLDQMSVWAIKLPSYIWCVGPKMFTVSGGHAEGTVLTKIAEQSRIQLGFCRLERNHVGSRGSHARSPAASGSVAPRAPRDSPGAPALDEGKG